MSNEGISLGLAGLSPHEQATVRLVQECLAERLHTNWRLTDPADADVVLADPRSESGRAFMTSRPAGTRVIAVLDRRESAPSGRMHYMHRPLGPAALVRALNSTQDEDTQPSAQDRTSEQQFPLAEIVRLAFRERHAGRVHVATGIAPSPLVIDTGRDRVRGPLDAVNAHSFGSGVSCSYRTVRPGEAAAIAAGAPETMLYRWAWRMAQDIDTPLFGDRGSATVRLKHWPNLSAISLPRKLFRVVTLAHAHPHTLSELVEQTRLPEESVRTMLNAMWLTGELEVAEQPAREPRPAPDPSARTETHSLLARLRNRLETA